jgi:DNA-binding HxlR family transcriptional regulator
VKVREPGCTLSPLITFDNKLTLPNKVLKVKSGICQEKYAIVLSMDIFEEKTLPDPLPPEMAATCATQPLGRAIRLIGDVWILLIVINLLSGSKRFGELLDAVGQVSSRTLTHRLKLLEELQFVERRAFHEIPPRVEYHLTEKGLALGNIIGAIEEFAHQHFV